jgi:hypothetical protein
LSATYGFFEAALANQGKLFVQRVNFPQDGITAQHAGHARFPRQMPTERKGGAQVVKVTLGLNRA